MLSILEDFTEKNTDLEALQLRVDFFCAVELEMEKRGRIITVSGDLYLPNSASDFSSQRFKALQAYLADVEMWELEELFIKLKYILDKLFSPDNEKLNPALSIFLVPYCDEPSPPVVATALPSSLETQDQKASC